MIFLTGATGYTGRFVLDALVKAGEHVRCLVRRDSPIRKLEGVSFHTGDLERPESFVDALAGCTSAISVAHIRFAPQIADACRKAGVIRAVFFSSTRRFSKIEDASVNAVIAGEEAVVASGLDYTLLRPSMIYGPGDDRNLSRLYAFLNRHRLMPIFGTGNNLVQPVYVEDVATATMEALWRTMAIGRAYTIAGPRPMTYCDMIDTLAEAAGRLVLKVHIPLFVARPLVGLCDKWMPNFPLKLDQVRRMGENRMFDISEALRELRFVPRSFERGVREAITAQAQPTTDS